MFTLKIHTATVISTSSYGTNHKNELRPVELVGVAHLFRELPMYPAAAAISTVANVTTRTTLVFVVAVPNYLSTDDFLLFCGNQLPHFQEILFLRNDGIEDRYSVLIRLEDQLSADGFYCTYNGKRFKPSEVEVCHIYFSQSVDYYDSAEMASLPPPGFTELPSCPVCLERLDPDTSGIQSTLCDHSFRCSCVLKWTYLSCPVCRLCQQQEEKPVCAVCGTFKRLWICLICGFVGCGRYEKGHASGHWSEKQHHFSLGLENQHIWDYVGCRYVHRLNQSKVYRKSVNVKSKGVNLRCSSTKECGTRGYDGTLDEYNHLLASQLDIQKQMDRRDLDDDDSFLKKWGHLRDQVVTKSDRRPRILPTPESSPASLHDASRSLPRDLQVMGIGKGKGLFRSTSRTPIATSDDEDSDEDGGSPIRGTGSRRLHDSGYPGEGSSIGISSDLRDKDEDDGGPSITELMPSYTGHVAHFIWLGADRGVIGGYNQYTRLSSWRITRADALAMIQTSGISHLSATMYEHLDMPLISAFVERWCPETSSFHMPFGEMTITLHDVWYLLMIPVQGDPVIPSCDVQGGDDVALQLGLALGMMGQQANDNLGWKSGRVNLDVLRNMVDRTGVPARRIASCYLLWMLGTTLFVAKSMTHGLGCFVQLLHEIAEVPKYAWGAATLANLYRELGIASRNDCKSISGCLTLLQAWIYAYFPSFRPQAKTRWARDQSHASRWIPKRCKRDREDRALVEHRLFLDAAKATSVQWTPFVSHPANEVPISFFYGHIHCRSITEPYMPDRVLRQFGFVQTIPRSPIAPKKALRSANSNKYVVAYEDVVWAFSGWPFHVVPLDDFEMAQVASDCIPDYMTWYIPRTHPRVCRVEDDEGAPLDAYQRLQLIAQRVAMYHPATGFASGSSTCNDPHHAEVLAAIAELF